MLDDMLKCKLYTLACYTHHFEHIYMENKASGITKLNTNKKRDILTNFKKHQPYS